MCAVEKDKKRELETKKNRKAEILKEKILLKTILPFMNKIKEEREYYRKRDKQGSKSKQKGKTRSLKKERKEEKRERERER